MKQRLLLFLTCLALFCSAAVAKTVQGVVTDASDNEPIIGASIFVKGTKIGASTDLNGEFSIKAPDNATTLIVSYVGMETVEVPITTGKMHIQMTTSS